ncbi:MAG TPA: hypothetical protein VIW29_17480 [Polyangiaceae bacterium]
MPRTVVTETGASSIPEILRDAAQLAEQKRWRDAALAYDRAYRLEPEGAAGDAAVWGAANAYDQAGDNVAALSRYELYAQRNPAQPQGLAARVRAVRLLVYLGRFEAAGVHADALAKNLDSLNELGRISVLSAKALALLERGDDQQASYYIEKGRDIAEANRLGEAKPLSRDLAQLYYALGELRRARSARIKFVPLPPAFGSVLEARCVLLLDAQSAYSDTMRANDAHWSAMAGFRVAELYADLHRDLLAVRAPASADTERQRQLFEGAVRTRYAILLSKAKGMAEHTLAMAARTGESSEWVERTRQALASIERGIAAEEAALAKLPYTKQDFEAYFAQMDAAAAAAPARATPKTSKPVPARDPAPGTL